MCDHFTFHIVPIAMRFLINFLVIHEALNSRSLQYQLVFILTYFNFFLFQITRKLTIFGRMILVSF